jgi:ketosteroid isomerase-like protein
MIRRRTVGIVCVAIFSAGFFGGCGRLHEARRREREMLAQERVRQADAAIRESSAEWAKATAAHDVDKAVYYYADDAIEFLDRTALVQGKDNIRKGWAEMLAQPGTLLKFATTGVDVAPAADMAWEHGDYEISMTDAKGKVTSIKGKYVCVWKREPGNTWKVVADIDNQNQ